MDKWYVEEYAFCIKNDKLILNFNIDVQSGLVKIITSENKICENSGR